MNTNTALGKRQANKRRYAPYATFNRNLIVNDGGFGSRVVEDGISTPYIYVLSEVMAEVQRSNRLRVKKKKYGSVPVIAISGRPKLEVSYPSEYAMLQQLGWSTKGKSQRDRLQAVLNYWNTAEFSVDHWYIERDDDGDPRYFRTRKFKVWKVIPHKEGHGFTIRINSKFYRVNTEEGHFFEARMDMFRNRISVQEVLTRFLLSAMPRIPGWTAESICAKVGIEDSNPRRLSPKIKAMVRRIYKHYAVTELEGRLHIHPAGKAPQKQKPQPESAPQPQTQTKKGGDTRWEDAEEWLRRGEMRIKMGQKVEW